MLFSLLFQYDAAVFLWINRLPHPQILNWLAIGIHYITRGMIVYIPLIIALLLRKKYKDTMYISVSILTTDILVDVLLKPLIHRPRPFATLSEVLVLLPFPGTQSFPSAQTAVAFAAATACTLVFENKHWRWLWAWAILVGLDRMYMGHHYPTDVLAGAAIGIIISIAILYSPRLKKLYEHNRSRIRKISSING